ncbi:MAG: hypothetical protein NZ580_08320 [Bacteroidia bacterium]|nr:hypothetical protein [Bacteroidia bacterium]MDW8235832.1 hypothetical protein [Bacteroidia bacterium]
MFWQEEDGVDVQGLVRRFEEERRARRLGYYTRTELEELLWYYYWGEDIPRLNEVLHHAIELYPDWSRRRLWQCRLALLKKKPQEAFLLGMQAMEDLDSPIEAYEEIAEICIQQRAWEKLRWAFQRMSQLSEEAEQAEAAQITARRLLRQGHTRQALPYLWKSWELSYPAQRLLLVQTLVRTYHRQNQLSDGIHAFYRYLEAYPEESSLWLGLARLYARKYMIAQSEQALHQAELLLYLQDPKPHASWGYLYRTQALIAEMIGHKQEAYRFWLLAREEEPKHSLTLLRLMQFYLQSGDFSAALPYVRLLEKHYLSSPMVRRAVADFYWQQGNHEGALEHYRYLMQVRVGMSEAIGRVLRGAIRYQKSKLFREGLRHARRKFRRNPSMWLRWIQESHAAGEEAAAYVLSREAVALFSRKVIPALYYAHAALAFRRGHTSRALSFLEQALLVSPEQVGVFYHFIGDRPLAPWVQRLLRQYEQS